MGIASEKQIKIDSGLVSLKSKGGHRFDKRASVNYPLYGG